MTVIVNGTSRDLPDGARVSDLLRELGLVQTPCAVEVNRELVTRQRHDSCQLRPGDRVELVTLVGGG
ncbi:MAG TPA: sulfur carrier protein ThiS [Phycisphaerales bacterium]|nr:sulfur carrier protein ThiS [Phycisphaerales bacterium]